MGVVTIAIEGCTAARVAAPRLLEQLLLLGTCSTNAISFHGWARVLAVAAVAISVLGLELGHFFGLREIGARRGNEGN